jgi:hypothetical protein
LLARERDEIGTESVGLIMRRSRCLGLENRTEVEGDVGADKRVPRVNEKKRGRAYRFGRAGEMGRGPFLAVV